MKAINRNESPFDSDSVFASEATVAGWDSDYYHPLAEQHYDCAVPDMLRAMGVAPGDRVVDGGCGPGVHAIRAARFGCDVLALDLSDTMLSHARRRVAAAGVAERVTLRQADLRRLPDDLAPNPFVFSWGVVIHVPETDEALDGLARLVSQGGRLGLQVISSSSLDFRIERLVRRLIGRPLALESTPYGPGVWYEYNRSRLWLLRFDPDALAAAMARRGFRLVSVRTSEFTEFQWRVPGLLRRLLLRLNTLAYRFRFPSRLSCTIVMVFEKTTARDD